ncbi:coiled-coil domain-containing protein 178 [Ctenodactylus gundi]
MSSYSFGLLLFGAPEDTVEIFRESKLTNTEAVNKTLYFNYPCRRQSCAIVNIPAPCVNKMISHIEEVETKIQTHLKQFETSLEEWSRTSSAKLLKEDWSGREVKPEEGRDEKCPKVKQEMQTLLSEAIHLIKSLETDRAEAEHALLYQKSRKKMISMKIDSWSIWKLQELPLAVQKEHEAYLRDIIELRWHLQDRSQQLSHLEKQTTQLEEANAKVQADIDFMKEQEPLLESKKRQELESLQELYKKKFEVKELSSQVHEDLQQLRKDCEDAKLKAEQNKNDMEKDLLNDEKTIDSYKRDIDNLAHLYTHYCASIQSLSDSIEEKEETVTGVLRETSSSTNEVACLSKTGSAISHCFLQPALETGNHAERKGPQPAALVPSALVGQAAFRNAITCNGLLPLGLPEELAFQTDTPQWKAAFIPWLPTTSHSQQCYLRSFLQDTDLPWRATSAEQCCQCPKSGKCTPWVLRAGGSEKTPDATHLQRAMMSLRGESKRFWEVEISTVANDLSNISKEYAKLMAQNQKLLDDLNTMTVDTSASIKRKVEHEIEIQSLTKMKSKNNDYLKHLYKEAYHIGALFHLTTHKTEEIENKIAKMKRRFKRRLYSIQESQLYERQNLIRKKALYTFALAEIEGPLLQLEHEAIKIRTAHQEQSNEKGLIISEKLESAKCRRIIYNSEINQFSQELKEKEEEMAVFDEKLEKLKNRFLRMRFKREHAQAVLDHLTAQKNACEERTSEGEQRFRNLVAIRQKTLANIKDLWQDCKFCICRHFVFAHSPSDAVITVYRNEGRITSKDEGQTGQGNDDLEETQENTLKENLLLAQEYQKYQIIFLKEKESYLKVYDKQLSIEATLRDKRELCQLQRRLRERWREYFSLAVLLSQRRLAKLQRLSRETIQEILAVQEESSNLIQHISDFFQTLTDGQCENDG